MRSIENVSEVRVAVGPPRLLIEMPHGATTGAEYEAVARRLVGKLPADLKSFYHVNTDIGAPECAAEIADRIGDGVVVVRGLVPRTLVDCNRLLSEAPSSRVEGGMTPGLPGYITDPRDVATLRGLHQAYDSVAAEAFEHVCGQGGLALILHTYAPRSVEIGEIDGNIVGALRRAYAPDIYETWDRRPDVDIICETADGENLAPRPLVESVCRLFAEIGVTATRNATYRLFDETAGHRHSKRWPGQVICLEINRELLADPWTPFEEMNIGVKQVRRMAAPIVEALRRELSTPA